MIVIDCPLAIFNGFYFLKAVSICHFVLRFVILRLAYAVVEFSSQKKYTVKLGNLAGDFNSNRMVYRSTYEQKQILMGIKFGDLHPRMINDDIGAFQHR